LIKDDITCNHYNQKEASIITSRGCMYNCAFCGGASSLNGNGKIRFRNNSDIRNEIFDIIKIHPSVTSIRVLDDLFLRNEESIRNATELFNQYPNLTWRGMAHILTFPKLFGTLPQLKASGCRELFVGIESGSETIRKRINKPGSPKDVVDVITMLLVAGIDIKGYFMYGFPDETTDEADETFALASELDRIANNTEGNLRLSVFQFRPYHGTQLYNEIESRGISIGSMKSNEGLNAVIGRSQFNFHSGNYSNIEDEALRGYIQKTQNLSEVSYV
jgi:radical SAM superfamily enzyme YgiQ (UPF0313 family)